MIARADLDNKQALFDQVDRRLAGREGAPTGEREHRQHGGRSRRRRPAQRPRSRRSERSAAAQVTRGSAPRATPGRARPGGAQRVLHADPRRDSGLVARRLSRSVRPSRRIARSWRSCRLTTRGRLELQGRPARSHAARTARGGLDRRVSGVKFRTGNIEPRRGHRFALRTAPARQRLRQLHEGGAARARPRPSRRRGPEHVATRHERQGHRSRLAEDAMDRTNVITGSKVGITAVAMAAALAGDDRHHDRQRRLTDIRATFGTPIDQIGWVSTGYMMANIVVIPLTGWFQRLGFSTLLHGLDCLFTIASALCGVSPGASPRWCSSACSRASAAARSSRRPRRSSSFAIRKSEHGYGVWALRVSPVITGLLLGPSIGVGSSRSRTGTDLPRQRSGRHPRRGPVLRFVEQPHHAPVGEERTSILRPAPRRRVRRRRSTCSKRAIARAGLRAAPSRRARRVGPSRS